MRPIIYHDVDSVMAAFDDAIADFNPDDLAFLVATGKSELDVRDGIAIHLNRNREFNQVITRE